MTPPRQHHRRTRPFNLINAGRCDPVRQTPEDFKDLQEALVHTESVEQFLHEMAVMAARVVGGGLSCGMTMRSNGRPVTVACSDPVAAKVDAVQYELGNGPCLHAMRDGHVVRIEDTAAKARWPEFERRAASHGIRSCLALPRHSLPTSGCSGRLNHSAPLVRRSRSEKYPAADPRRSGPALAVPATWRRPGAFRSDSPRPAGTSGLGPLLQPSRRKWFCSGRRSTGPRPG